MIDRDRAYDQAGQWTDSGRERYKNAEPFRNRRDRKRRAVIPAYSDDPCTAPCLPIVCDDCPFGPVGAKDFQEKLSVKP